MTPDLRSGGNRGNASSFNEAQCSGLYEVIVQACINGSRKRDYHPRLPLTVEEMVEDAIAVIEAGAAELRVHPRDKYGRESLHAVDETVEAIRTACPGTPIGVSTAAWIAVARPLILHGYDETAWPFVRRA